MTHLLITGAAGYIGGLLGRRLASSDTMRVTGTDLRPRSVAEAGFEVLHLDVRDRALEGLLRDRAVTHVVHLASVLESSGDRERDHDIDVHGTRNVVDCCVRAGVRHLTVASSGAAYGYHADNPAWLTEDDALRATSSFAYAHHKRLVEEMLASYRTAHPRLTQLVLRIGTVLGATTRNQITALFEKRRILGVRGSDSPFVFIWDEDVVGAIAHGLTGDRGGIYNLAGDGALTIHEIAARLGKPTVMLPAGVLRALLTAGRALGVSRYGPEQLDFLRFRPVLCNRRLKQEFGYLPRMTSSEAFQHYLASRAAAAGARTEEAPGAG